MPDILIRGMEMPRTCSDCSMCYDMMECTVSPLKFWYGRPENEQFDFCKERHPSCPLVELPPHGDLIDRDALPLGRVEWEDIDNATVIVPSNKEDANG